MLLFFSSNPYQVFFLLKIFPRLLALADFWTLLVLGRSGHTLAVTQMCVSRAPWGQWWGQVSINVLSASWPRQALAPPSEMEFSLFWIKDLLDGIEIHLALNIKRGSRPGDSGSVTEPCLGPETWNGKFHGSNQPIWGIIIFFFLIVEEDHFHRASIAAEKLNSWDLGLSSPVTWVEILVLPLISCVTPGKVLNWSASLSENGVMTAATLLGVYGDSEIMYVKCFT